MNRDPNSHGLEQALARAASDADFRAHLLAERSRAVEQAGIALSDSERAILDAVPVTQLETMIAGLPAIPRTAAPVAMPAGIRPDLTSPVLGIRPDEPGIVRGHSSRVALIALGAAVAGTAIGVGVCAARGHTAEVPPPRTEVRVPAPSRPASDGGTGERSPDDPKR